MSLEELDTWFWFFAGFFATCGVMTARSLISLMSGLVEWALDELAWKKRVRIARRERRERESRRDH